MLVLEASKLQLFIKYIKGTANVVVDALSRKLSFIEPLPTPKTALLKKGENSYFRLEKANFAQFTTYKTAGG